MGANKKVQKKLDSSNIIILLTCILLIVGIVVFSCIIGNSNEEKTYTIEIKGESSVVVYKGNNYEDPGAKAYDEDNTDFSQEILVENNVNVNKTGRYEIVYSLGDISVKRVVRVIDVPGSSVEPSDSDKKDEVTELEDEQEEGKSEAETYIKLKGSETVYLDLYGNYKEEGYVAEDKKDGNIKNDVKVTHNIDNKTPGIYYVVYSVKNSRGVTTSVKRTIIVMDIKMSFSLTNSNYTNNNVGINVSIVDDYFDYLILPNGSTVKSKNYTYIVSQNGTYKFKLVNKHGAVREGEVKLENIDRVAPTGTCTAEYNKGKTIVTVNAKDNIGVKSYVVNGKQSTSNVINLDSLIENNTVQIYDHAGNVSSTSCVVKSKVYIESISRNGVIVTVKAGNINSTIAGYYFNTTNSIPDKNTGKFISTSNSTIDVVRLPGTTYVWVEDTNGKVSEAGTINVPNDALLITYSGYNKLENMSLESYLSQSGWSKAEFDKLIARSVRAAGVYSKEAAATAGVAMQTTLAQKYKIKLPYWWGGKSWEYGADKSWGIYKTKYSDVYDVWYYYYGLDCSGFAAWAYVNAGYDINRGQYPSFWSYSKYAFTKENGDVGDFILSSGHVKLIVGKTETGFICAEAAGKGPGMCLSTHSYSKSSGYWIAKGENIANKYAKDAMANIPTGM